MFTQRGKHTVLPLKRKKKVKKKEKNNEDMSLGNLVPNELHNILR
jgi:hypothetical protein